MRKIFTRIVLFLPLLLDAQLLQWPPAPEQAKIEWTRSFNSQEGLGTTKGFWMRVAEFLFGESREAVAVPFGLFATKERLYVTDIEQKRVTLLYRH